MKTIYQITRKLRFAPLALCATAGLCLDASAVTISTPMTISTQYVVGIAVGQTFQPTIAQEAVAAQTILNLSLGGVSGVFQANTVFDYSGTIDALSGQKPGGNSISAGWEYALAKYDGPNGGSVLFYLGGTATTFPLESSNLWLNGQSQGYGISHFTVFNPVTPPPRDPGNRVPDGGTTLVSLGVALLGLGSMRRLIGSKA